MKRDGSNTADIAAHVEAVFARARTSAEFVITTATDLDVSFDGTRIAFTAVTQTAGQTDPAPHVAVFDTLAEAISHHGPGRAPRWDPTGQSLAWLADDHIVVCDVLSDTRPVRLPIEGVPEYAAWRPDGIALLVGVAEHGAARSDVEGSGTILGAGEQRAGAPVVEGTGVNPGSRGLLQLDPVSGDAVRISPTENTVWQATWAGKSSILCVVSEGSSESSWYGAGLALLDLGNRELRPLPHGRGQVGLPAANRSGTRLSAVIGAMSDRGAYAGDLVVIDPDQGLFTTVPTDGVDVTSQHWADEATIVFAGMRGLDTVIGRYLIDQDTTEILSVLPATCGSVLPEIAVGAGVLVCTTHGYGVPPALSVVEPDGAPRELASFAHDGTEWLTSAGGKIERVAWEAPDGVSIEGFLVTPAGPGPHPLIVNIHGGPVWAWRDEWTMHYPHTPLLVSCGYAVLHPNIRGSIGRGQRFVTGGLLDMGGTDAADLLAGLDVLVEAGRVDPARIAVTGNSYGGFMSAWLVATSERFAAAVPRSPVTDWVSQHYTSNIPGFDRISLSGDPLDPGSSYRLRSPLYLADRVHTPVLLMAGAHDLATPAHQASMFHRALIEHGAESTLVIYPDEGHGVRGSVATVDQCIRMIGFFNRHLARED